MQRSGRFTCHFKAWGINYLTKNARVLSLAYTFASSYAQGVATALATEEELGISVGNKGESLLRREISVSENLFFRFIFSFAPSRGLLAICLKGVRTIRHCKVISDKRFLPP